MRKSVLGSASAIAIAVAMGGTAWAADMPVKAAPAPAAQLFNWTGFYVGGHVGEDWAKLFSGSEAATFQHSHALYGGHLGYNVQSGQWVWGWEADLSGTSNKIAGSANIVKVNMLASLRGRLGIAFDRVLFYGTAGIGWVGGKSNDTSGASHHFHTARPVVGGGIEYAMTNQWLVRAEALGYLGTAHAHTIIPDDLDLSTENLKSVWQARVGLTYKFDSWGKGPVSARY